MECSGYNKYLLPSFAGCSATCDNADSAIILDNLDGRVNICVLRTTMASATGMETVASGTDNGSHCRYYARV